MLGGPCPSSGALGTGCHRYPRCITHSRPGCRFYTQWTGHGIRYPPNYAVPAGPEVTRAPRHLRNSTCLAHGRSHGSFPVDLQRAIKKVPPLGSHTLLHFFYFTFPHDTEYQTTKTIGSPYEGSPASLYSVLKNLARHRDHRPTWGTLDGVIGGMLAVRF